RLNCPSAIVRAWRATTDGQAAWERAQDQAQEREEAGEEIPRRQTLRQQIAELTNECNRLRQSHQPQDFEPVFALEGLVHIEFDGLAEQLMEQPPAFSPEDMVHLADKIRELAESWNTAMRMRRLQ